MAGSTLFACGRGHFSADRECSLADKAHNIHSAAYRLAVVGVLAGAVFF